MSHSILGRLLERADEVAKMPEVPAPIVRLHAERLAPLAATYRAANAALIDAEASASKERREATAAVAAIATPYKLARSIVRARDPESALPEALTSLATDTDRKLAIGELLARLGRSAGEGWADELLGGDFGRIAPDAIREIDESVHASSSRKKAVDGRAAAFGPAYEELISFKAAVLAGMGAASTAYQRLVYRTRGPGGSAEPGAAPESGGA